MIPVANLVGEALALLEVFMRWQAEGKTEYSAEELAEATRLQLEERARLNEEMG